MDITIRNRQFKVDPGQNRPYWEYINSGTWETATFDILDQWVKPDDVVMDLGAWSGVISLYIAEKASKVYAVDPDPVCFQELQTNIDLNPEVGAKIKPLQVAVSDSKEEIELSARQSYGQSSSSILHRKRDTETSHRLSTLPLPDLLTQEKIDQLDFIKMDIEGAEFKVLPTLPDCLKALDYPTLMVSFHYAHLLEYLYARHISSGLINKVALKLENWLGLVLYKSQLHQTLKASFEGLKDYAYIYTIAGQRVKYDELMRNPSFIKNHDLVFSMREWVKA